MQEPNIPPLFQTISKAESPLSFFGDEVPTEAISDKSYSRYHSKTGCEDKRRIVEIKRPFTLDRWTGASGISIDMCPIRYTEDIPKNPLTCTCVDSARHVAYPPVQGVVHASMHDTSPCRLLATCHVCSTLSTLPSPATLSRPAHPTPITQRLSGN